MWQHLALLIPWISSRTRTLGWRFEGEMGKKTEAWRANVPNRWTMSLLGLKVWHPSQGVRNLFIKRNIVIS